MDQREQLPFQTLVNSLDTDYGKRTPKHLATIRLPLNQQISVRFLNAEAKVTRRLLLDRFTRENRKIRIFLEPGDLIAITEVSGDFENIKYYRAEKGPRNIRLSLIAGPSLDENVDKKIFQKIDDSRLSWACRTFDQAVRTLTGIGRPNMLGRLTAIATVNLIFEEDPSEVVINRCNWFAPYSMLIPNVSDLPQEMTLWGNPDISNVENSKLADDTYIVGIDSDTYAIRVLCNEKTRATILKNLLAADIHSHQVDNVHKLLMDQSNDLVELVFPTN